VGLAGEPSRFVALQDDRPMRLDNASLPALGVVIIFPDPTIRARDSRDAFLGAVAKGDAERPVFSRRVHAAAQRVIFKEKTVATIIGLADQPVRGIPLEGQLAPECVGLGNQIPGIIVSANQQWPSLGGAPRCIEPRDATGFAFLNLDLEARRVNYRAESSIA